jgi:putative ABC transport system permease protein
MAVVATFLRRIRVEPVAIAGVGLVVLVTAFVFAVAPRLLARTADDALRTTVARSAVASRNLQLDERTRICACGDQPLSGVESEGADLQQRVPPVLRSAISDRVASVDTTRWSVVATQPLPPVLTIRFEPRAFDHIRLVEGRLPAGAPRTVDVPATTTDAEGRSPVYEIALVRASADKIGAHVGDTIYLRPDRTDPQAAGLRLRAAVEVVGIYEVPDPGDPFWYGEAALLHPTVRAISAEIQYPDVYGLAAPGGYPIYLQATESPVSLRGELPLRYHWRLIVDPSRLSATRTADLIADLRRLETVFPASEAGSGGAVVTSSLLDIVTRQDLQWRSALAVLTVMALGPASIALAALALVALLTAQRRRATASLWRARGASPLQLGLSAVGEALAIALPAGVIAGLLAVAVLPGGPDVLSLAAVVFVAAVAVAVVLGTIRPALRGELGADGATRRAPVAAPGATRRRAVLEATLIGLAILAVWLLRDRSVHGAGGAGAVGIDPLVAAAPALAGAAAGLVAMRLVLLPMGLLARASAGNRGLVVALALRRATRGGAGAVVLLVLLATAMIGGFSAAALGQLDRSADAVSWHDVGAPFRISAQGGTLGADLDPSAAGAEASTAAYRASVAGGSSGVRLELLAVDPAAYAGLVAGEPVDAAVPAELLAPATASSDRTVPALVSSAFVDSATDVHVGSTFTLVVDARQTSLRVVGMTDSYPTLDPGTPFVVVSRPQLEAARGTRLGTTDLFLAAPDSAAPALRDIVAQQATGAVVRSRTEEAALVRDSPIVRAVGTAVAAAAIIAGAYAAVAVAAALALASAARTAETAILRTFGLSRREGVALVVAEHGPIVALAFGAGLAVGLALFLVLRPGLGLAGIVGSNLEIPLAVEPAHVALLLALVAVIAATGIGLGAAIQRRALLATVIRRGVE